MKRWFLLAVLTASAFGQGSTSTGSPVALDQRGRILQNALIAVCNNYPGLSPIPPCGEVGNSLVTIYTDYTLGHACSGSAGSPISNLLAPTVGAGCSNPGTPINANVLAFAPQGFYWCEYYGSGLTTIVQPCTFPAFDNLLAPGPIGGTTPSTASFTTLTVCGANGTLNVGSTCYPTIESCYAALSVGGTCQIPPNFTETPAGNILLNKNLTSLQFMGAATINLGANQLIVFHGTNGVSITGPLTGGRLQTGNPTFVYTGTTQAINVGSSGGMTLNLTIKNIGVDLTGAGTTATGFKLTSVARYNLESSGCNGSNALTQVCIQLDGAFIFTGDGVVKSSWSDNMGTCIKFDGSANSNQIIDGSCPGNVNTLGLYFTDSADGNNVIGYDVEQVGTAVKMDGTNFQNHVQIYGGSNNVDYNLGASTIDNTIEVIGVACPAASAAIPITISDSGTNNKVLYGCPTNFSRLPSWGNGNQIYCADCTSTCAAGSSTGQLCSRVNGAWVH